MDILYISKLVICFIIFSFIGWAWEVILYLVRDHKFVNRGFMIGPICPIYGVGGILIITLLSRYKNDPVTLFIMAILICSIVEYYISYIAEKLFHIRWWDYSKVPFNINGRISLITSLFFGILGSFGIYVVFRSC